MVEIEQDILSVTLKPVQEEWRVTVILKDQTTASASGATLTEALKELAKLLKVLRKQE